MKPYDKYVPSGVEWIGEIPEGWEVKKLKYLFSVYNGATPKSDNDDFWNGDIIWITPADYCTAQKYIHKSNRQITEDGLYSCAAKLVPVGSIIVSNRAPIGTVSISTVPLTTNQGCKSMVKKTVIDERFIYYFLSTQSAQLNILGKGTTFLELSNSDLSSFSVPLPTAEIQTTIANYLDFETARIDNIIKAKEMLIERLKEKRISVITYAVTKGLDHDAQMKSSGVDWIGDIPEGWEVKRLKYVAKKIIDGTHATPEYLSDGIPFLRVTDISSLDNANFEVKWDEVNKISTEEHYELIKRCNPQTGDLLVSKNGTIGVPKIVDWDYPFSIFVSLCLIKLTKKINVAFLYYYFLSSLVWTEIAIGGKTGTITNLHLEKIKEFAIPFPPLDEQTAIANYLDTETAKIDTTIEKTKLSIEKLKEYRAALISACVTGKIDVRDLHTDKEAR